MKVCRFLPIAFLSVSLPVLFHANLSATLNQGQTREPAVTTSTASTPTRDAQAVTAIQNALAAMGKTLPVDSVATGTVTIVAGTKADNGTIRIQTRGTDQASEQIQLSDGTVNAVVFSKGQANEVVQGAVNFTSLELASSSQSADYPLPLLTAAFNNPDFSFQYVGQETLDDGSTTQHVRFWNTYSSNPAMLPLSEFTTKDLWVNAKTGLPQKLTYLRREAGGPASWRIAIGISYSDWRGVDGVMFPYQIQKSWNGTPWTTITIQNVAFQTGLTDNDFPVSSRTANTGVGQ
jgi:hypothetical protein